jgi:kynureninase
VIERAHAEALDAADGLASFRDRFVVADEGLVYADGNSLGRLPRATVAALERLTAEWGERLVRGWSDWIEEPVRVGDRLAPVIGAGRGEVVVCDSTTVNLYKLAAAALAWRGGGALLADRGEFPTDRYVLEGLAAAHGVELRWLESDPVRGPDTASVAAACRAGDVALVVLSHVHFRSGALADLPAITAAAAEHETLVLWDLSHSAGAVPVDLVAGGAALAVGCTYKYLNGGPGAPAYLYVRRDLQEELRSPVQGWFGQRDQFLMGPEYEPAAGIERFLAGTPSVLGLAAVAAGVELLLEAGVEALRRKSVALTELTVALHDERLAPLGFRLSSPRDGERRGGHVALAHDVAWPICRVLVEQERVVPDFRPPDVVRLGFAPLYSRFVDVWDAVDRLAGLVERGDHLDMDASPARVT